MIFMYCSTNKIATTDQTFSFEESSMETEIGGLGEIKTFYAKSNEKFPHTVFMIIDSRENCTEMKSIDTYIDVAMWHCAYMHKQKRETQWIAYYGKLKLSISLVSLQETILKILFTSYFRNAKAK